MTEAVTDLNSMTVAQVLASGRSLTIADHSGVGATIFTTRSNREILRIEADGRLVRGKDFRTDDEASVAFFDCLSEALPGFLHVLRQRAETAERELAALKMARTAEFTGIVG